MNEKNHWFHTFNILAHSFLSFSWQIIHLKNVDMYIFWGGEEGSEKMYVLYTHLNVDNYGQSL